MARKILIHFWKLDAITVERNRVLDDLEEISLLGRKKNTDAAQIIIKKFLANQNVLLNLASRKLF